MSTSQRAPLRFSRRLPPSSPGDGSGCISLSPQGSGADTQLPTHSPCQDAAEERLDSVLLSSRSTTTSLTRLQTPSNTARASAFTEVPLSYSPQMVPRSGGAKLAGGGAGVVASPTTAAAATLSKASPSAGASGSPSAPESGRGKLGGQTAGQGEISARRDGATVIGATPEKGTGKRHMDGSTGSPSSQVQTSGEKSRMEDSAQLRPVEESLSFEFFSNQHPSGSHNPSSARAGNLPVDARMPRGMVIGGGNVYRESPMAPNMLPMVPIPDSFSQRYMASISSRDQQPDGRYAAMSQSSRFEDAHQLTPRPLDGEMSLTESSAHHRVPLLDDIVRHSTTDSFVAEDGPEAGAGSSAAQPPRVDASMNSQNFMRNYKRRHAAKGRGGGANAGGANNGRYTSTSMSSSPQMSADVAAPGGVTSTMAGAPEVFSSDQLTHMPSTHKRRRGGGGAANTDVSRRDGEVSSERPDGNVLGMNSSDLFVPAGGAHPDVDASSPANDDFSIVRAPVSGLRAKVLGNAAVDEDEAAEDPEARERLAQQIQSFATKVVQQRHDKAATGAAPQPPSSPQACAGDGDTRAEILRRANAAAAAVAAAALEANTGAPGSPTSQLVNACPTGSSAGGAQAKGSPHTAAAGEAEVKLTREQLKRKKRNALKRVRFNLEGLTPRDEEGPNALQMPRHGAVRSEGEAGPQRPLSPPVLASVRDSASSNNNNDDDDVPNADCSGADVGGSCGCGGSGAGSGGGGGGGASGSSNGSGKTSVKRHSSPTMVDVRSVLRAGVTGEGLLSPASPAVEKAQSTTTNTVTTVTTPSDSAEVVVGLKSSHSPKLTRYPTADSSVCSPVQGLQSSRDEEDQPQGTPVTPDRAFTPMQAPPSMLVSGPSKSVPVPPAPTTIGTTLTSCAQEPQKKQRKSAGKIRKATKMHRKAAVALVAGASESVTVASSSNASSLQHSQQAPFELTQNSLLSSIEVCIPESGQHPLHISLSSPSFAAPSSTASVSVSSASTTANGAASAISPKRVVADSAASTPTHRIHVTDLKAKVIAAGPPAGPPPLRAMQVVPPRQPPAVPLIAAAATAKAAGSAPSSKGGEVASRRPSRRGSAGTHSSRGSTTSTNAATTAAGAASGGGSPAAKAGATAPSSRRSSISLAGPPTSKSGTYAELPPLSNTSHSHTSTPDVNLPPTTPTASVTGTTHTEAGTPSLAGGEVHVLLPAALARRHSASHETVESNNSTADFAGGNGSGSGPALPPPALRQERSCSTVEYKGDRERSPLSAASSSARSITREPSLTVSATGKAPGLPVNAPVLPQLSSFSLKPQNSSSQTMSPPPA